MNKLRLIIHGTPQPKQSVRSGVVYGKDRQPVKFIDKKSGKERILQTKFQPKESVENERSIKLEVLSQLPQGFKPFTGPIRVNKLHFVFPPLKTFSKKKMKLIEMGAKIYKDKKPDLMDNLNKGLFDALEGVVFLNDSQIVSSNNMEKFYGLQPRIELELEEIGG